MRTGRPRERTGGFMRCTCGNHMAPAEEFPVTGRGTFDSWCRPCRREYNRFAWAVKARAKREARVG